MEYDPIFMRVDEVAKVLEVSESYAYKVIKQLNNELSQKGKLVVCGRVTENTFMKDLITRKENENVCI